MCNIFLMCQVGLWNWIRLYFEQCVQFHMRVNYLVCLFRLQWGLSK